LAFVSIHPKAQTGKYQDQLANDGYARACLTENQTRPGRCFFFLRNTKKPLPSRASKQRTELLTN